MVVLRETRSARSGTGNLALEFHCYRVCLTGHRFVQY
jgi:hypothetical protein